MDIPSENLDKGFESKKIINHENIEALRFFHVSIPDPF